MKGVYIFLADGFEDIEALAVRDVLVRGNVDVRLVSISDDFFVKSSHDLQIMSDDTLDSFYNTLLAKEKSTEKDFMIFPGGMPGSKSLGECRSLINFMNEHYAQGGSVAAICAAPAFVLSQLGGIENADFTCYEGCEQPLIDKGAHFRRKPAVVSGRILTGRGPGHAIEFGLEILKYIKGEQTARKVAEAMTLPCE